MMNEESSFGASFQDQNARSNSSQAYLQRAASAVEEGDIVLGIHLYMAAYERALRAYRERCPATGHAASSGLE